MLKRWLKILSKVLSQPLIGLIKGYQLFISPILPPSCRYTPSCSQYAIEAFKRHGVILGFFLAVKRIISCNPWWGGCGYDPVPDKICKPKTKNHAHNN